MGRILAVDPGSKRIGIAISDPFRILATPLSVIKHESMTIDSTKIIDICQNNDVKLIIIGQPLSSGCEENPQTRHARKLADTIRKLTSIPVAMWDESDSTKIAKNAAIEMGMKRKKRTGHLDELAATVILQSYLDNHQGGRSDEA